MDQEGLDLADPNHTTRVGALTLGALHELYATDAVTVGLGGDVTVAIPNALAGAYGGGNPLGFRVFLRVAPPLATATAAGHQGH